MTTDIRAALKRLLAVCDTDESNVLDIDPDLLLDAIAFACAALAAEPVGEGPSDEEITLQAGKFLAYSDAHMGDPARWEGSDADLLAFARAVLPQPARPAAPPTPEPPAEALAARPLLEQVARLGDCIGANTVGQIMAISSRAAAWLEENPPGQPVAIEPRGCPTPGACSCVEPTPAAPEVGEVGEVVAELVSERLPDLRQNLEKLIKSSRAFDGYSTMAPIELADRIIDAVVSWHLSTLLQQQQHLLTLAGAESKRLVEHQAAPAPAVVPVAVAVAERLPGEGETVRKGGDDWAWGQERSLLTGRGEPRWRLMRVSCLAEEAVNWLPHHAFPLPQGGEGEG